MTVLHRIGRWWRAPAPVTRLAALRVIIGGFALGYVLIRAPHLADFGARANWQFEPVGVADILASPLPGGVVQLLVALTAVSGLAFVLGWRYRWTGPAFALLLLWVATYRNSWGQVFHTENLMVLHALILAFSPAADALSLDARRSGGLREDSPQPDYGWPIRLMCAVTVLTYFISGQTKLRVAGLDWITTDSLRNHVAYDNLRKAELGDSYSFIGAEIVRHGWLFPPLAAFALIAELGAPLALLSSRLAKLWVACAWLFHAGVLATMAILFPYPLAGIAFAPFFEVEKLRLPSALGGRWLQRARERVGAG